MLAQKNAYTVANRINGHPTTLHGADGAILCFEKYAAVVERADKAYSQDGGFSKFTASIDDFAQQMQDYAQTHNLKISPFDFDVFCDANQFAGTETPSERFGKVGVLDDYDNAHPLMDDIDRRTTSGHFSVGYKDLDHLWRQIKVMTILTPTIYAAFASSPPCVEIKKKDVHSIVPKHQAKQMMKSDAQIEVVNQLRVPRAQLWTLSDANRTGIAPELATAIFDPKASFQTYVDMIVGKDDIGAGKSGSFQNTINEGASNLADYMQHVSTLWYDVRVDLIRLEVRSAGNAPWKSKALGALLTEMLLNEETLQKVESYIADQNLSAEGVLSARADVGTLGLKTTYGQTSVTAQSLLQGVTDIVMASTHDRDKTTSLQPLKSVLDAGKSDSDILAEMEDDLKGDFKPFLNIPMTKLEPFVVMQNKGTLDLYLNAKQRKPKYKKGLSL